MKIIYSALLLILVAVAASGQSIPDPMQPPRMVNDFSGLLDPSDRDQLENKLQEFYFQTSTQIYVVTVDGLDGMDIAEYTFLLGDKWGVGTKGRDNGAVILMNPSADHMRGDVFIATGYGLEGAIPDALAKRIIEFDMVPSFKQQDYFGGLQTATTTIMDLSSGEYTAEEYLQQRREDQGSKIPAFAVMLFLVIVFSLAGRGRAARQYSMGHNIPFWLALFMVSSSNRSNRGSFGNFSSGSGGFGGFGGGGFGGGGGGSFGGGGAGGSW